MYKIVDSQLDFKSLIKVCVVANFGFTLILAIFVLISVTLSGSSNLKLFASICLLPFSGLLQGLFVGVFSYPFYSWWCKKQKGHRISGIFIEPSDV